MDLIITNDKILFNEIQIIESIAKTCDHLAINVIIDYPKYIKYKLEVKEILDINESGLKIFKNKLSLID